MGTVWTNARANRCFVALGSAATLARFDECSEDHELQSQKAPSAGADALRASAPAVFHWPQS